MKAAYALAGLSALMLSACTNAPQSSGSSPTPAISAPTSSPSFSTPNPANPRNTQGSGDSHSGAGNNSGSR